MIFETAFEGCHVEGNVITGWLWPVQPIEELSCLENNRQYFSTVVPCDSSPTHPSYLVYVYVIRGGDFFKCSPVFMFQVWDGLRWDKYLPEHWDNPNAMALLKQVQNRVIRRVEQQVERGMR